MQSVDEAKHERRVILQKGAISSSSRNALWTAKIEIYGVGEGSNEGSSGEEMFGVIGAELYD